MDKLEALKSVVQDMINNKEEQAAVTMHDYFVMKTREVTGLGQPMNTPDIDDLDLESNE